MSINAINQRLTDETTREVNAVIKVLFHTVYHNKEVSKALDELSHMVAPNSINKIRNLIDYIVLGAAQFNEGIFHYTSGKYQPILADARKHRRSLIADKGADKASRIAKSLGDKPDKPDDAITITGKDLSVVDIGSDEF